MGSKRRTRYAFFLGGVVLFFAFAQANVGAEGTPAGTEILNRASVTYDTDEETGVETESNTVINKVAEILDLTVTWIDATNVIVAAGGDNQVLTFRLTNTGNGIDSYALTADDAVGTDQFDPELQSIYLDDGDGTFNPGLDDLYTLGTNDPELDANDATKRELTLFVLCNIPDDAEEDDLGKCLLRATSNTATGPLGTVVDGAGDEDSDLVIGASGGVAEDTGIYEVKAAAVEAVKAVVLSHPDYPGLETAISGATLTYTIQITVAGDEGAEAVLFTDPIPDQTTYKDGTLTLNGAPLSDPADADAGDVGDTTPGVVTVNLGDLAATDGTQTIRFAVTVD